MRIAIDYTAAIRQEAGIGVYVRNLVAALLAQNANNFYTLLTSGHATRERPFPEAKNAHGQNLSIPDRYLNILWYRWRFPLPATLFTGPIDIYHGPDFVLPPLKKNVRKVVTVHDLAFIKHPEYAVPSLVAYLRKVVPEAVQTADVVATISHDTSTTLIEYFKIPPKKLVVVPPGVDQSFRRMTDPLLLNAVRHKFELQDPLILAVGTQEPRKNHLGLIKAFHQASQKGTCSAMLAIAGGKGWLYEETKQLVNNLNLQDKVRFLGRVSQLELIALYSVATFFAFPSFFEGFGIPPLEAMACGAPVLTSNISSLPEFASGAALLVDPYNIDEMAQAITRLLEDDQLRLELQRKGYERARQYSWEKSATKMLRVYEQLATNQLTFVAEETHV